MRNRALPPTRILSLTTTILIAALLLGLLACGEDKSPTSTQPPTEVDALIDELGEHYLSGDIPEFDVVVSEETWDAGDSSGESDPPVGTEELWACREEERSVSNAFDAYPTWDPNSEVIWPGSALQGQSITRSTPDPVIVPRGPGAIVLNILVGTTLSSCEVDEVTQSNVIGCANDIIAELGNYEYPADGVLSVDFISSERELQVKVKANASYFAFFKASASFELDFSNGLNKYLVSLNQAFYTLSFERPARASDFFVDDVTQADVSTFMGPGNPPVYVSSVTYGRGYYLLIESSESIETMRASLDASFGFGGFGGGISGETKHVTELEDYRRQVYAYGGDAAILFDSIEANAGPSGLDNWLETALYTTGRIDRAVPLTYSVRSVRSATLVKNGVAAEWTSRQCIPVNQPGEVSADVRYVAALSEMSTSSESCDWNLPVIETWRARAGNDLERISQTPFPRNIPSFRRTALNDHGGVEFRCGAIRICGSYQDYFAFNGASLVGTDYTMMAVVDFGGGPEASVDVDDPPVGGWSKLFLESASGSDKGLAVGTVGRNALYMGHDGEGLSVPVSINKVLSKPHVFTFEFSQTEGMAIYVDSELQGRDQDRTTPLSSFPGARLGLSNLGFGESHTSTGTNAVSRFHLGDLLIFKKTLSAGERERWENDLRSAYGI